MCPCLTRLAINIDVTLNDFFYIGVFEILVTISLTILHLNIGYSTQIKYNKPFKIRFVFLGKQTCIAKVFKIRETATCIAKELKRKDIKICMGKVIKFEIWRVQHIFLKKNNLNDKAPKDLGV